MKQTARFLIAGSILLSFCNSALSGRPRCNDGCRRGSRGTGRNRNPWRMSRDDRTRYLEGRLEDYRHEFYGGGGQETLDRLTDKLRPYRDFWVRWRNNYQDLPAGSKERQTVIDKLRWVRDVLRGGLAVRNEFRTNLANSGGDSGGTDTSAPGGDGANSSGGNGDNGGADASTPADGTNTPTPGTDSTTPGGGSEGEGEPGAASLATNPWTWVLLTISDQEADPEARAGIDGYLLEAGVNPDEVKRRNLSQEQVAEIIERYRRRLQNTRGK